MVREWNWNFESNDFFVQSDGAAEYTNSISVEE